MPERIDKYAHTRKPRFKEDAGSSLSLAKIVKTPEEEFKEALSKGVTFPSAGVPDFDAMFKELGLYPEMMQRFDPTRRANGTLRRKGRLR